MKNPKKILLPAFCAASLLSLAGCGSGPGKTYVNCTRFFADGNTEKALTCMDPSLMQKPGAKEKMSAMISMASAKVKGEHKGIAKVNLLEEKIDGDMATVKVHIKYSDGTEQDDSGSLKRIDRKWYLINSDALLAAPFQYREFGIAPFLLAACRPVPRQAAFDERLWDSLSCGDIVFLDGATLRSEAVRALAPSASAYSHVGIVTEAPSTFHHSRNHWRIVHASPGGGSGLPDADARVREEPLDEFLADPHVKEAHLWRWKGDAHIACAAARWAEKQVGLPFDRDFRFETDSALYCTELVWKAFRSTGTVLCDPKGEEVRLPFRKGWILFPVQMTTTGALRRIRP